MLDYSEEPESAKTWEMQRHHGCIDVIRGPSGPKFDSPHRIVDQLGLGATGGDIRGGDHRVPRL
jgi:hypothetical protein